MLCERKSERKEVAVRGWIFAEGQDPRQCTIEDASAGGAKRTGSWPRNVR